MPLQQALNFFLEYVASMVTATLLHSVKWY